MRQVFPQPPMVAFRRVKNNKDILHVVHKKYNNIIYNKPNKCEPCGENCALCKHIRDRPFNLKGGGGGGGGYGFLFRSEHFFRRTRELEYFFFVTRSANFFSRI